MPYLQETGEVWDVLWPHNLSIFQGFLVAVRNIYKCSDCILESPTEGGATYAVTNADPPSEKLYCGKLIFC